MKLTEITKDLFKAKLLDPRVDSQGYIRLNKDDRIEILNSRGQLLKVNGRPYYVDEPKGRFVNVVRTTHGETLEVYHRQDSRAKASLYYYPQQIKGWWNG